MKYNVTLNGKIYEVDVTETDAVVTGISQVPVVAAAPVAAAAPVVAPVEVAAAPVEAAPAAPATPAAPVVAAEGTEIKAPMPGTVVGVKKNVGDAVKAGDVVIVLEAMKMENDIVAPCDGTVKAIVATKGSTVNTDDVLAVI